MLHKRKILFFIALLAACLIPTLAQYLKPGQEGRALVLYKKDAQRFYTKNISVAGVPKEEDIVKVICLDKKNKLLYVATDEGVYELSLDKEQFNQLKKDKSIPQMKKDEVWEAVNVYSNQLDNSINSYNKLRSQEIADSIVQEQIRLDSLRKAREKAIADSIAQVKELEKQEEYRRTHSPYIIKNPSKTIARKSLRNIYTDNIISYDTVYIASVTDGKVALKNYGTRHYIFLKDVDFLDVVSLDDCLLSPEFAYHYKVFADSLDNRLTDLSKEAWKANDDKMMSNFMEMLCKMCPNGLVDKYGWDKEYGTIKFSLDYANLSKYTIKYLTVDVGFYNAVDDLRTTGTFNGTGPIPPGDVNGWEWDDSLIFTYGDETYCKIRKITITYSNGKKVVLTGDKIKYSPFEED